MKRLKRLAIGAVMAVLAATLMFTPVFATDGVLENYESGATEDTIYGVTWTGQTFEHNNTFWVSSIQLYSKTFGTPSGDATVEIRATSGGLPTGGSLVSKSVTASGLGSGAAWNTWEFDIPIQLTANTAYAIVVSCPSGDVSNYFIQYRDASGTYANGQGIDSADSGVNWTAGTGDNQFRVYGYYVANPIVLEISSVYVYRHLQESNDQLYVLEYNINYGTWSGDYPAETATEAFVVRLMNGSAELGSTAPYAYYHNGYDTGVAALYFTAVEAPAWEGSYTMEIAGNPTLNWAGDPPEVVYGSFDNWSTSTTLGATSNELGNRVLYFANALEVDWAIDLIQSVGGAFRLSTDYGENYFPNVIENLRAICPDIFTISVEQPTYTDPDYGEGDYSVELDAARAGTIFDWSGLESDWGDAAPWFVRGIFLIGCLAVVYFASVKVGSYKPAMLLLAPMIFIGVRLGIFPLVFGILIGFIAAAVIGYVLFAKSSSV